MTIDDPNTSEYPDYEASGVPVYDPENMEFVLAFPLGSDFILRPGQVIRAWDSAFSHEMTVETVYADPVQGGTGILSGTATPGLDLDVAVTCEEVNCPIRRVTADLNGIGPRTSPRAGINPMNRSFPIWNPARKLASDAFDADRDVTRIWLISLQQPFYYDWGIDQTV